jgi:CheY-like chemotaxis protein
MANTILVVDDEPYMRRLMQHHLARAGYALTYAVNGREAVEMAGRDLPALIIMDVMMPEMDGLTALKQLKADKTTRQIPVIILTASAQALTRQESEASGATLFLTKPFSPTLLMADIKRLLAEVPN